MTSSPKEGARNFPHPKNLAVRALGEVGDPSECLREGLQKLMREGLKEIKGRW